MNSEDPDLISVAVKGMLVSVEVAGQDFFVPVTVTGTLRLDLESVNATNRGWKLAGSGTPDGYAVCGSRLTETDVWPKLSDVERRRVLRELRSAVGHLVAEVVLREVRG